jgi:hypothetical protein
LRTVKFFRRDQLRRINCQHVVAGASHVPSLPTFPNRDTVRHLASLSAAPRPGAGLPSRRLRLQPRGASVVDKIDHKITDYNTRVPAIARVCRESRQVVFETWTMLALPERGHHAYWYEGWSIYPEPWFDRIRTDIVHLGWRPTSLGTSNQGMMAIRFAILCGRRHRWSTVGSQSR